MDIMNQIFSYNELKEKFKRIYFRKDDPIDILIICHDNEFYAVKSIGNDKYKVFKKFITRKKKKEGA